MQPARILTSIASIVVLFCFGTAMAIAAPEDVKTACDPDAQPIPGFVPATAQIKLKPRYPTQALNQWSEGWVLLEYAIGADGAVRDLRVVDALGPKDFVKASVTAVSGWRYDPAKRNGAPVDQYFYQTSVLFLFEGTGREAEHAAFVRKYNRARDAIKEKQYDEAITLLQEAFRARLNLYEEAMGSFVLALAYANKRDWQLAQFHIRHATIEGGNFLEKELKPAAFDMQVQIEAHNANYAEAQCAFAYLKEVDPGAAAGTTEAAKIIGRIDAALKDPKPLAHEAILAQHPLFDAPAVWRHRLLRPKFYFAQIKGEVKSFRLACLAAEHATDIDPEMQWTVPEQAGPCMLRVDGAPGASFLLVEEN